MTVTNYQTGLPTAATTARIKPVHRTEGPLRAALREVPEWRQAWDQLEALQDFPVPDVGGDVETRTVELIDQALERGSDDPDALLAEVISLCQRAEAAAVIARASAARRARLVNELDLALVSGAPRILRHLHAQLGRLLSEAVPVYADLGPVRTADDAISAGVVEQWKRLPQLGETYAAIRSAQWEILGRGDDSSRRRSILATGFLRNPQAVDGDYLERRLNRKVQVDDGLGNTRDPRPTPWPDLATPEALEWLCRHPEVQPWVPTKAELEELEAEIGAACRELVTTGVRQVLAPQAKRAKKAGVRRRLGAGELDEVYRAGAR